MIQRYSCLATASLSLLLLCSSSLAAEPVTVPYYSASISADGRLDETLWRDALRFTHHEFKIWRPFKDKSHHDEFVVRLAHNGEQLLVAVASYDRYVEHAADPANSDGLYAFSVAAHDGTIKHYRMRWTSSEAQPSGNMLDIEQKATHLRGPFADPGKEGGGYVIEFAVPFTDLGWNSGDTVKFNVLIQDHNLNPDGQYNIEKTDFARFALGSFNNDDTTGFVEAVLSK